MGAAVVVSCKGYPAEGGCDRDKVGGGFSLCRRCYERRRWDLRPDLKKAKRAKEYARNRDKYLARSAEYVRKFPEARRRQQRQAKGYALNWPAGREQSFLLHQKDACFICQTPFIGRRPDRDHSHCCPKLPRGLLCGVSANRCNLLLGQYEPELLALPREHYETRSPSKIAASWFCLAWDYVHIDWTPDDNLESRVLRALAEMAAYRATGQAPPKVHRSPFYGLLLDPQASRRVG